MTSDKSASDETLLMTLWEEARRRARVWCGSTLARLRRGEGGFYEEDDLWQDLFLEFWDLLAAWRQSGADREELWALWRKRLWRDGWRVIRRTPQRLWQGVERAVEPATLALERPHDDAAPERTGLPQGAVAALRHDPDGPRAVTRLARVEALERALWALPPDERQVLYLNLVVGLPAADVARCLDLCRREVVYQRMRKLRRHLHGHLAEIEGGQDDGKR